MDATGSTNVLLQYGALGVLTLFACICTVILYRALQDKVRDINDLQEKRIAEAKANIQALHDNTSALNELTKVVQTAISIATKA